MLRTEDSKTVYLVCEDSKYTFMCWEPEKSVNKATNQISSMLKSVVNVTWGLYFADDKLAILKFGLLLDFYKPCSDSL